MSVERPFSEFSGVAGRVLDEAISPLSFVSGLVLGVVLMGGVSILAFAGAPAAAMIFVQIVMALALVRFALNGLQGEWGGTVFSSAGGGASEVARATLRYLALSAILIVPTLLVEPAPGLLGGAAGGAQAVLLAVWFVASVLAPPVFLIMSVTVTSFGELGSPDVWRGQFAGRLRDLVALYVVYIGALAIVALGSLPFLAIAFAMTPKFGVIVAGGIGCLLFGIAVNLAGRLCGFFACGELGIWDGPAPAGTVPPDSSDPSAPFAAGGAALDEAPTIVAAAVHDASPTPASAPPAVSVAPVGSDPTATRVVSEVPAAPDPTATRVVSEVPAAPDPTATRVVSEVPAAPDPTATEPTTTRAVSEITGSRPAVGAGTVAFSSAAVDLQPDRTPPGGVPSDEPWPAPPRPAERRPPLLDAAQRVEAALRRFHLEPAVAVGALQELNASFAPDPHVLAALGLCFYRGKNEEKGVTFANEALPMILERGLTGVAVDIFKTMRPHLGRLRLDGDALLTIAAEMVKGEDLAGSAKAYSAVIGRDPDEARAIKGLLQVAERLVEEANRPDAAVKVYRYLLQHCAASPLVDFMQSGLEDAERALARAEAPTTP